MTINLPDSHRDLFDKKAFAHLATLMPDGSPQVTPVWVGLDGDLLVVNSAKGRRKDLNMRADARVSLSMSDPDNAYRYLEVRGQVIEITEQGADDQIDSLAMKYLGTVYPHRIESEVRVRYVIKPTGFSKMG